jgi:hypothetical protein
MKAKIKSNYTDDRVEISLEIFLDEKEKIVLTKIFNDYSCNIINDNKKEIDFMLEIDTPHN